MKSRLGLRLAGGAVAAAALVGLAAPAGAYAATSTAPGTAVERVAAAEVGAAASWRTIGTYRTSFTCAGEKARLELSTPWVLRCQKAGTFTYYLQRYH